MSVVFGLISVILRKKITENPKKRSDFSGLQKNNRKVKNNREIPRLVAGLAADAGIVMMDAPVSGGTVGAEAGTLTFMVGGDDGGFAKAKPLLDIMGKNIIHAGGHGNGQAAKIKIL